MRPCLHLHLTAAQGPAECRLAVAGLVDVLCAEAAAAGLVASLACVEPGAPGLRSAVVALAGDGAATFAAGWTGAVRWTCRSPLRPGLGRKNWFVAVAPIVPPEPGCPGFGTGDLAWETFRASGRGGQHVNTTDSAVRLRHRPSGLVVECREVRSQHRNRAGALLKLAAALQARAAGAAAAAGRDTRARNIVVAGRGAAAVRAYRGPRFAREA